MNRIIEVDDKRHFAIVEPGVAYFDLYRHIQERGLKVQIDVPDPGWGSLIGNAMDHGVGYGFGGFRDHFYSHCGMEVVLPNGEIVRTGMGALPGAKTWGEYHYGVGPYVDGLFGQGNFGVVTKMGFHLLPAPEAYLTGTVIVPKRNDIVPLVEGGNHLEHAGVIGMPEYGSPLGGFGGPADPELRSLLAKPGGPSVAELEQHAEKTNRGFFSLTVQFYGGQNVVRAQWEYAKEVFAGIRGVKFNEGDFIKFPATPEQLDKAHKVAIGVPNMSIFTDRRAFGVQSIAHRWTSMVLAHYSQVRRGHSGGPGRIHEGISRHEYAFAGLAVQRSGHVDVPRVRLYHGPSRLPEQYRAKQEDPGAGQASDPGRRRPRLGRIPYAARFSAAGDGRLLVQQPRAAAFARNAKGCGGPQWDHLCRPVRNLAETNAGAEESMRIIWALIGALGVLSMNAAAADAGQIEEGKQVYQYWCWNCHGEGVGKPGTQALAAKYKGSKPAILDQRTDLTPAVTKIFVRKGVSIMPFFRKTEISDAQLDALAAYLAREHAKVP